MADDDKPKNGEPESNDASDDVTPSMLITTAIVGLLNRKEVADALATLLNSLPDMQKSRARVVGWNQVLLNVLRFALAGAVVGVVWHLTSSGTLDKPVAATLLGGIVGSLFVQRTNGTKS